MLGFQVQKCFTELFKTHSLSDQKSSNMFLRPTLESKVFRHDRSSIGYGSTHQWRSDSLCKTKATLFSPSNSLWDQDIAKSLAEPVRRLINLLAAYFRCDDFVEPTSQPIIISFTYRLHVLEEPSHEGTEASPLSFDNIAATESHREQGQGASRRSATNAGSLNDDQLPNEVSPRIFQSVATLAENTKG